MPELPEVEQFRQILLPLVSTSARLNIAFVNENPPRKWLTAEQVELYSGKYYCRDVLRKGKLLCLVLKQSSAPAKYLFLHMGMTGRISAPNRVCRLENVKDDGTMWPPAYTYLSLQSGHYQTAFSDPRKFGSAEFSDSMQPFDVLAQDALSVDTVVATQKLSHQGTGIKAILLDQKRVFSGVGNWVADEILYQCQMHPDQAYLSEEEARKLLSCLKAVLQQAVEYLGKDEEFPDTWLFNFRWTKKMAGKDSQGRKLTFLTSGGRTSAIVSTIQKLRKRSKPVPVTQKTSEVSRRKEMNGKRAIEVGHSSEKRRHRKRIR